MQSLFEVIGNLIQWFGSWIPRLLIMKSNCKGVAFVKGKNVRVLEPGLRIYWPLVTEVFWVYTVRQIINLSKQTLYTKDKQTVVCDGLIVYTIEDIVKYLVDNHDAEEAIAEVTLSVIRNVIVEKTVDEIQKDRVEIDKELTKMGNKQLRDFGAKVVYIRLSDFAPAIVLNLVGNNVEKALNTPGIN